MNKRIRFELENRKVKSNKRTNFIVPKIGVCASAMLLVLTLRLVDPEEYSASSGSGTVEDEEEFNTRLGKLSFVEMPGILEVFAPLSDGVINIDYSYCEKINEDTVARLYVLEESTLYCASDASVTSVMPEENTFAVHITKEDIDVELSGMDCIRVEQGQPLKRFDIIGSIRSAVTVRATKNGVPVDPMDYVAK